ncbi:MAG: AMP-binding protein [Deltaproteobacteria bacterium]|nr:AMP-binding protein [Deltaproteobacteria bacterium]
MNIAATLTKALNLFPDQPAVVEGDLRLTYGQVGGRVRRLAQALSGLGLKTGDRISIIAPNGLAFLETYYAAAFLGLIVNPINIRLAAPEMAYILNDAGSRLLLAQTGFTETVMEALRAAPDVESLIWLGGRGQPVPGRESLAYEDLLAAQSGQFEGPPLIDDSQPAHLYYTSGTTGRPKGVILTHRNVTVHALAAIAEFHVTDADHWFHVAPMFHLADAWATFALTWVGGLHVMVGQFEAGQVLALIEKEKVTLTNLIPTMLNLMVNHPHASKYDYSSLRLILSGGAPIPVRPDLRPDRDLALPDRVHPQRPPQGLGPRDQAELHQPHRTGVFGRGTEGRRRRPGGAA